LLLAHLPLLHDLCDSSDQTAHYHALSPKFGDVISDPEFGCNKGKKRSMSFIPKLF
jgi:hypothetical protein